MPYPTPDCLFARTRREFLAALVAGPTICHGLAAIAQAVESTVSGTAFQHDGAGFVFDTRALRGTLRAEGKSQGLLPVFDGKTGSVLTRSLGLFSHYRMLDSRTRYGRAGWDWSSTAQLEKDGAVLVSWAHDAEHPFDMKAVYRWSAADQLDLATTVTAQRALQRFELFLASYFEGFARAHALVKGSNQTNGHRGFHEAKQADAVWHMYPRDEQSVALIQDGRWKLPPNPVEWTIMPQLAGALAMRRDEATGLTALIMAPPADCFAVAMPYGEETHRSIYLSLIGQDLKPQEPVTVRARLILRRGITDQEAQELYAEYCKS